MAFIIFVVAVMTSLFLTDVTTLLPLDLLNSLRIPQWIFLFTAAAVLSWCMGE
jgi:hypothetical protein